MKVLTLGIGSEKLAKNLWGEAGTIKTTKSLTLPKGWKEQYDVILAYQVLQRVSNAAVLTTLRNWRNALKPGGELHIFVPSLEWVAREILNEEPSPMMLIHIFGVQNTEENFWLSGFTMRRLRVDLPDAGFAVKTAKVGYYSMNIQGVEFQAEQHYIVGRKVEEDAEEIQEPA